jgi:hypothetical protein
MFPIQEAVDLLTRCHRRCCICHRFCGVKIELDHIDPRADGGGDAIDNAIPVCFECHAEIHSYNDRHPRGRKFRPQELRRHKEQWLQICAASPHILLQASYDRDVGPLQALLDEIEFNREVAKVASVDDLGCPFRDAQFARATAEGVISVLNDELKSLIIAAYVASGRANQWIFSAMNTPRGTNAASWPYETASRGISAAAQPIEAAHTALLRFLSAES